MYLCLRQSSAFLETESWNETFFVWNPSLLVVCCAFVRGSQTRASFFSSSRSILAVYLSVPHVAPHHCAQSYVLSLITPRLSLRPPPTHLPPPHLPPESPLERGHEADGWRGRLQQTTDHLTFEGHVSVLVKTCEGANLLGPPHTPPTATYSPVVREFWVYTTFARSLRFMLPFKYKS